MKKKLIAKLLLCTMIIPYITNGASFTYALPPDNKYPGAWKDSNTPLFKATFKKILDCIDDKSVPGKRILDLSKMDFDNLKSFDSIISGCITNKGNHWGKIDSVKLSYNTLYLHNDEMRDVLLRHILCLLFDPMSNTSLSFDYIEPPKSGNNIDIFDFYTENPHNKCYLECDSMLICKKTGILSVEGWLQDCKKLEKKYPILNLWFKTKQLKKIVSYGETLTKAEKEKICSTFKEMYGIEGLEFIENPDLKPVSTPSSENSSSTKVSSFGDLNGTRITFERIKINKDNEKAISENKDILKLGSHEYSFPIETIIVDGREVKYYDRPVEVTVEKPTRLEPVYLANVFLHYEKECLKRKQLSSTLLFPQINKGAKEASLMRKTSNIVLNSSTYKKLINYIPKIDAKLDSVTIWSDFLMLDPDTIETLLRELSHKGVRSIYLKTYHHDFWISSNTYFLENVLPQFIGLCKSYNIRPELGGTLHVYYNKEKITIIDIDKKFLEEFSSSRNVQNIYINSSFVPQMSSNSDCSELLKFIDRFKYAHIFIDYTLYDTPLGELLRNEYSERVEFIQPPPNIEF